MNTFARPDVKQLLWFAFCLLLWFVDLLRNYGPLSFDDAFMFYRYAEHIRSGLGVSWNLDGVHTYGPTSLLWLLAVLGLSFLPASMGHALIFGSWLCSGLAILAMTVAVSRNATSPIFRDSWNVLPLVAVPLTLTRMFFRNAGTGMETMLAMALCAAFIGLILNHQRLSVWLTALTGILFFLTRPESGLIVVAALLVVASSSSTHRQRAATTLVLFLAGVALSLCLCKIYFHTALPLSFYVKSRHFYTGYPHRWYPVQTAAVFISQSGIFLIALAFLVRRRESIVLATCLIPLGAMMVYLCTVTQIMGFSERYYVPYLPLIVIPVLLSLYARLLENSKGAHGGRLVRRMAGVALVIYVVQMSYSVTILMKLDGLAEGKLFAYDQAHLFTDALRPLPDIDVQEAMGWIGKLAATLPRGTTIAASEVGYVGAVAPQINIIDLAALNDSEIALHGFDPDRLLLRKPDLIWLPHTEYTYQRGILLTDPALLDQYDVIADAAQFGLAVRKDSPRRAAIEAGVAVFFNKFYPGYNIRDYLVHKVTWDRKTTPSPVISQIP